jgi:PHD and RING finger domain-containing protein 1
MYFLFGIESESDGEDESDDSEDDPDDDLKLTDDTNKDQCAICLMEFTDQKVGIPNNCTHVFCLVCIQEWAKVSTSHFSFFYFPVCAFSHFRNVH